MKYIGAHVSASGGVSNAPLNAKQIGATGFALFLKNQRQWKAKPFTESEIDKFKTHCREANYSPDSILPHDSYLINPGAPDPADLQKARDAFIDEFERCHQLGLMFLNFHPGSHKKKMSDDACIRVIAESINMALDKVNGVTAVIENTVNAGGNIGYRFEHLAAIIENVDHKQRVGVCVDTCHAFASGYDLRTPEAYEKTMADFDAVVGLNYLKGIHLNDSKGELNSRKDRHESLGKGHLGWETFQRLMEDPRLDHLPMIIETNETDQWPEDIRKLKEYSSGNRDR
ncbi:MAG: deoxyribonuclease IV [Candidatus Omnitrophota bacterium]